MPRNIDPSTISTGTGQAASPPEDIAPLTTHLTSENKAHPAQAVLLEDPFQRYQYLGTTVEQAFAALAALVPVPLPGIGARPTGLVGSTTSTIPDWGILKLNDSVMPSVPGDQRWVYPYYARIPLSFSNTGADFGFDGMFNYYDVSLYPQYTGGGLGLSKAAFVTVSRGGAPATGYPSWRLIPAITDPAVVVSGVVFPADRGVLALIRWPAGSVTFPAATSVADVQARCPAAILLGNGVNGSDGSPGGIFEEESGDTRATAQVNFTANPAAGYTVVIDLTAVGGSSETFTAKASLPLGPRDFLRAGSATATAQNFALTVNTLLFPQFLVVKPGAPVVTIQFASPGSIGNSVVITAPALSVTAPSGGSDGATGPYNFPGRVAGQFHLDEIHTGTKLGTAAPYMNPAAGQVRLLTRPEAFPGVSPATATGGIPILGATDSAIGTTTSPYFPFGLGGGTAGNFFGYRLPQLRDYAGILYTPEAERTRFTTKLLPAAATAMPNAGNYGTFPNDFWAYQLGRYRHRLVLASGASGTLRRNGSLVLVHFKREADFEACVRDGVIPTSDKVYSVNLVSWTGASNQENFVSGVGGFGTPASYTVLAGEIDEDPAGSLAPTLDGGSTYTVTTGNTIYTSGVQYYVPWDRSQLATPAFGITGLNITLAGIFDGSYRTHDKIPVAGPLVADQRRFALNLNPVFMSLASFCYEGTEVPVASTISIGTMSTSLFPASLGEVRRQRLEFGFADLTSGALNPTGATPATISATAAINQAITFAGDVNTPVFTTNAKLRVFVRRPLAVDGASQSSLPFVGGNTASSRGFTITETAGNTILYHSMKETVSGSETVAYGNPSSTAKAGYSTTKDKSERFLDEVYRYPTSWSPLTGDALDNMVGPGIPHTAAAILVPVRPGTAPYTGWFVQNMQLTSLASLSGEAQVAGLPARNPAPTEGLFQPAPSRGLLMYPQTNYSTGYSPAGPDYSGLTGTRRYVRVFDAGSSNLGQTQVTLRIWGVQSSDFAWSSGSPGSANLAILVKLPGLSTWMDAGRTDGAGPSKTSTTQDGAGCRVSFTNGLETATRLAYVEVVVNLGAALFVNTQSKCPVAVMVVFYDTAGAKALNFDQGGEDGATNACRGVIGIDVNVPLT